ncbi:T9SS type B sorting domain-containing protein [Crocinitomix catalasitica]|uniref:T9SS type B sorting domain-containing protein n=1 Tax=Crocinitomix catalasitica TaxID=184607 RepID=UPI00146F9DFF|nr:gliding motility-associated C-terminal domain-containing protein [Crocinitomix catalasitica]
MKLFYVFTFLFLSLSSTGQTILPTDSSPVGTSVAPIGWTIIRSTTDISDSLNWGGMIPWRGVVNNPPNGDTVWVSGFTNEIVGTTITDLIVGVEYSLNFYMAEIAVFPGDLYDDGTLLVNIGGDDILYPFTGGFDYSWSEETLIFTATDESMLVTFQYEEIKNTYWNISFASNSVTAECDLLTTTISETELCFGEELTLNASSVNGGTISWDGGVTNGISFNPPGGTTTYTATSDNEDDCTFSIDILVHKPEIYANVSEEIICLGDAVIFTGDGLADYIWDKEVINNEPFEPVRVGLETYTVTGTDEFGCSVSAMVDLLVSPLPNVNLEFIIGGISSQTGILGGCIESEIQFNDLSTIVEPEDIVDWAWLFGDGEGSDEQNPIHNYLTAGTYTVILTVTSSNGCSASFTKEIIMSDGLLIDIVTNEPTCYGFSDGSATVSIIGSGTEFIFNITDQEGHVLNESNSNTANSLNSGWYYFDISDGYSCSAIDSVFFNQPNELDIEMSTGDVICHGENTGWARVDEVINATGDYNEITYIWNPNPADIGGVFADSSYNLKAGNYVVSVIDENGCSKVFDFDIIQPDSMYFIDFGTEPAHCRLYNYQSGNGVVFGAVIGGTSGYDYKWKNLDTDETISNSTWGARNPGYYELTATDALNCTIKRTIYLDSINPIANFTVDSEQFEGNLKGTAPIEVILTNTSENFTNPNNPFADTNFFWNLNQPNADWQLSQNYFEILDTTYKAKGQSYTIDICLVALNKNGCSDTTCKTLTIFEPISFSQINVFTPNGDGINDVFSFEYKSASISEFNCVFVNRWGNTIFEMNNIKDSWNGTNKSGEMCQNGVYFYTYSVKTDNGTILKGQGSVSLIDKEY